MAPPIKGKSMMVHMGKGCRVRWARMIFVVMRPKTKDMVRQKRTSLLSRIKVEYGEYSQAVLEAVKMMIGDHSAKTGAMGRCCARRALTTLRTHAGRWMKKNVEKMTGIQTSMTEASPNTAGQLTRSVTGCVQICGP